MAIEKHPVRRAMKQMHQLAKLTPATAPNTAPNCRRCRHFAVSWQPATPYLCRLMGFSSQLLPCVEVARADGVPCRGFDPK